MILRGLISEFHFIFFYKFNPLGTKFFFSSFFGTLPKIGSFRFPAQRRDATLIGNFFDDPFLK